MKKTLLYSSLFTIAIMVIPPDLSAARNINLLVHPFQYKGPASYTWLTRGLTETVLSDFMKIKSFNVFSETDRKNAIRELELSMGGALEDKDIAKVGSLVGADIIFTGRVQVAGKRVRISARLVDVKSAQLFKSLKLDGAVKDILKLQNRIIIELLREKKKRDIADLPPLVISDRERKKILERPGRNFNAYEYYSLGLENQISDTKKALNYFEKAFHIDPDYFEAYLEASQTAGKLSHKEKKRKKDYIRLEEKYLERAADILKRIKKCDYKYAYIIMMKGIKLGKQHRIRRARNLLYKAEEMLKCLGQERSTNFAALALNLGNTYFMMKDYKKSMDYYEKSKSIYSDLDLEFSFGYANTMINIGNVYSDRGEYKKGLNIYRETHRIIKRLRERNPELYDSSYVNIGTLYRMMNNYPKALENYRKAREMIEELDREDTYKHATLLINFAAYYEEKRNRKKAARMYRKAYAIYIELGYEGPLKKLARDRARLNERGR
jgi:tetratricopeptide (TPR) repeat protein